MEKHPNEKPVVLCVQPPIYDFALYDLFLKPYGLMRLAGWFKSGGYTVKWLNALGWKDESSAAVLGTPRRKRNGTGKFFKQNIVLPPGIERIPRKFSRYGRLAAILEQEIRDSRADIVCITTGMTYWYKGVVEMSETIRRVLPDAKIILGGIYASLMPGHAARSTGADLLVTGDDIAPLKQFLGNCALPVPDNWVPVYPQPEILENGPVEGAGVIRLNTGCPLHCDYCASNLITPRFHHGDADAAFTYLETMYREFGTRSFGFYDDALLVHKDRVLMPFLEKVIRSNLDIAFYTPNAVHIRYMDRECAELLRRAGFREVRMGYESGSSEFHEKHDGKFRPDEFSRSLKYLHDAGFEPHELPVYILAGLPGQHRDAVRESILTAAEAGASVSIAEYSPVPGTPMWEQACRNSHLPLEDEPLYHNNIFFATEWEGQTRSDLQQLKQLAAGTRENKKA